MKVITNFDFVMNDIHEELSIESSSNELTNYESLILVNPITGVDFPGFDKPFFDRMDATLDHILYQYEKGWITSERQVFYTSNECLTTIQFVFRGDRIQMNVFQRSSNVNNLKEDIQFLNYFLKKVAIKKQMITELNVFVSMPHEFHNKKTKVGE